MPTGYIDRTTQFDQLLSDHLLAPRVCDGIGSIVVCDWLCEQVRVPAANHIRRRMQRVVVAATMVLLTVTGAKMKVG